MRGERTARTAKEDAPGARTQLYIDFDVFDVLLSFVSF